MGESRISVRPSGVGLGNGGVDAEPSGSLPAEHAVSVGFVEETAGPEVAKNAALDDALELDPVVGLEPGRPLCSTPRRESIGPVDRHFLTTVRSFRATRLAIGPRGELACTARSRIGRRGSQ